MARATSVTSAVTSDAASTHPTASGAPRATASPEVIARRPGDLHITAGGSTPEGYGPSALRGAYNLVSAAKSGGKGAIVAVIGVYDDPDAASDLATYRATYGLPACAKATGCFQKVNENGQAAPLPPTAPPSSEWTWPNGESADADMVSAICPNCHILLLEATGTSSGDLGTAVDSAMRLGARYLVVGYDTQSSSPAADAGQLYHPGIAITVPAGDNGFNAAPGADSYDYPATSPYVTTVGGTTLTKASNSRGWTETVWGPSRGPGTISATSSGCSSAFGKPSWEKDTGCSGRTTNDVAAVANPDTPVAFYDTAQRAGGWWVGGGTTVPASIVSAVYALAGVPGADTLPASYPAARGTGLYPVTSGTDAIPGQPCSPAYLCTAGPGYNGPAGWGTPDGTAAFGVPAADTVTMIDPPEQAAAVLPEPVDLPIQALDSAGKPLTYTASGLPAGVSIDPATGIISGTVTTDYSGEVTVTASDADAATATVSFAWKAQNSLSIGLGSQRTEPDSPVSIQVFCYEPDKSATVTFSADGLPPGLAIDPATGVISGATNSTIASYDVTLTATDSAGSTSTITVTWDVWNLITVTATDLEQASLGVPVSVPVSATDSAPGSTLTFTAEDLPSGLTINPVTGTISGTPAKVGPAYSTVIAADGTGSAGGALITWQVFDVIALGPIGAQVTGQGQAADLTLNVSHRAPADTVRYTATGLPPGVTIDLTSPVISGFPVVAGTYHVSVTANGFDGGSATQTFTWTVPRAPGTGPAGHVRLGTPFASLCLDDPGNSSATGTRIRVRSCDANAEQRWTYALDGTLRIHGKCLDVAGNPGKAGTATRLWPCTGTAAEQWGLQAQQTLVSLASGLCLSDSDKDGVKHSAPVVVDLCGFSATTPEPWQTQEWELPAGPVLSGIPGRCLDVYRGQRTPGAEIDLIRCNGDKAQAWSFDPFDETVRIFGLCLTRTTAFGTEGSHLSLRKCTYANPRQWWDIGSAWNNVTSDIGVGAAPGATHGYSLAAPTNLKANPALVILSGTAGLASNWHIW